MFGSQSKEDNLTEAMLAFAHSVQTYKEDFGSFIAYARTGALMWGENDETKIILCNTFFYFFSLLVLVYIM